MSKFWARISRWMSPPAHSRSELVMVPWGLEGVRRLWQMSGGQGYLQRRGWHWCVGFRGESSGLENQTPPVPRPEASWYPMAHGLRGMSSAILVGRLEISAWSQRKSERAPWTDFRRAILFLDWRERACCMALKRLRDPGSARLMLRSSPSILCHFFVDMRIWAGGMLCRIVARRSTRWGGVGWSWLWCR